MAKDLSKKTPVKTPAKAEVKVPKKNQHKIRKYFKDLRSEFKKVVWPTKKQVINNTGIVLIAMCISGIFIWGLDTGLSQVLKLVLQRA